MYVKLPLEDLNPDSYHPYHTITYTCKVTTTLRVRGGEKILKLHT